NERFPSPSVVSALMTWLGVPPQRNKHATLPRGDLFTIWTLSARFTLGVKSIDSRETAWRTPPRSVGAGPNAGDNPDGEQEAAFSSVGRGVPRPPAPHIHFFRL